MNPLKEKEKEKESKPNKPFTENNFNKGLVN
jgi:hypothetical protein